MRKHIREMIRAEGKRKKLKPSRWVKVAFDTYQNKRYGVKIRKKNQAIGTHKKYLWRSRAAAVAE